MRLATPTRNGHQLRLGLVVKGILQNLREPGLALGNPAGILLNDSLRNLQGLLDARAGQLEEAA